MSIENDKKLELNAFDISLLSKRRVIIIRLIEKGKLDSEVGMELYDITARPEVILEEREAEANPESDNEDSPLGRLLGLYSRLNPKS